jgi:pimeloyl-ACP methyl ester carboxylesterase
MSQPDENGADLPLAVVRSGAGPSVVFIHGGLPARVTWARQSALSARWSILIPSRRGFMPSPPADRQDFLVDTRDLAELLQREAGSVHLVGFSYGGLSAVLLAGENANLVRSLTVIEAPFWVAAHGDPEVEALARLTDRFTECVSDEQARREFMAVAGIELDGMKQAAPDIVQSLRLGRLFRSPREAAPKFDAIRKAGIPSLVVSGDHHPALESVCDGLARELGGRRVKLAGAGHAVPRAEGFNALLEAFLLEAESARSA